MTIGQFVRKILGKNFHIVGRVYRSVFVDLRAVARSIEPHIPKGAMMVDVGGGGGQLLNFLLSLRNDITVKMIDLSPSIGDSLKEEHLTMVETYPGTSIREFMDKVKYRPDVILISDVIHHIPLGNRKDFFIDLRTMVDCKDGARIIIKDLEPGYFRSTLGRLADRYISGDKKVSLVGRADICNIMSEVFGNTVVVKETTLFELDKPNYALLFEYKRT